MTRAMINSALQGHQEAEALPEVANPSPKGQEATQEVAPPPTNPGHHLQTEEDNPGVETDSGAGRAHPDEVRGASTKWKKETRAVLPR